MANEYFVARGAKQFGPFSGTRLKELATSGRLHPTDTVWKHGMTKGVRAGNVSKLFPAAEAVASPDDTAVVAAKVHAPVPPEPAPASPDAHEAPVEPAPVAVLPEPTLELVPIEEDPEPRASHVALTAPAPDPQEKAVPSKNPSGSGQAPARKRRAEALRGAIIVSQDGAVVQYRKKCVTCGHESNTKNSMPIRSGSTTTNFFCPKCKKLRGVVIRGSM